MDDAIEMRRKLLLSVQRALLGAVPAALRAVTCGWDGTTIKLHFVFDGEITSDDFEVAQVVATEVIADFTAPWTIDEQIVRIDHPHKLREDKDRLALCAYLRRERRT